MATNVVKTTFIGDTRPLERSISDYKRSLSDLAAEAQRHDAQRQRDAARLAASTKGLAEYQSIVATKAAETRQHVQFGTEALLRSAGASEKVSSAISIAAANADILKTELARAAIAAEATAAATSLIESGVAAATIGIAAGVVSILAVKKLSEDIRESAEKRLATEIEITREWNRQINLAGELQKTRDAAAQGRADDYFLQTAGVPALERERDALVRQYNEKAKQLADETRNRNALDLGPDYLAGASAAVGYDPAKAAEQKKQILEFDAKIDQLRRDATAKGSASEKLYSEIRDENLKKSIQAAQKAAQDEIELIKKKDAFALDSVKTVEELKRFQYHTTAQTLTEAFDREVTIARKREELIKEAKKATESLFNTAVTREGAANPFLAFLGRANQEMQQLLETAKNLSPAMREAFVAQAQRANRDTLFGLRLDTQLDADSLRRQAGEFRQGYRNDLSDPETVQKILDKQLKLIGLEPSFSRSRLPGILNPNAAQTSFFTLDSDLRAGLSIENLSKGAYGRGIRDAFKAADTPSLQQLTEKQKALQDQRLLNLAGGLDPKLLRDDQRDAVASAFEREANRKLDYEKNANDFFTNMLQLITKNGLKVDLAGSVVDLNINNNTGGSTAVRTSQGTNRRSTAQAMGLPVSLNTGTLGT